ncbi:MAG: XRE family transcriptional regulator [Pedobacter sp.]|nr:MAG: XRE family transcriptional regulator [Pedobacter sp.]
MEELGKRIRQRREELGWTQDDLAQKFPLKSGKQTISRWESGKHEPGLADIKRLAELLDVTIIWLIEGTEPDLKVMQQPPAGYILMPAEEVVDMQRRLIKQQQDEIDRQKV